MNFRRLIGRFLTVFAIVGLVAAPLVSPAAAKGLPVVAMADISAVLGDMPCCPDGRKSNGCQDCPLAAMCLLSIAQAGPSFAEGIRAPLPTRSLISALDALIADGLIGSPPDHPPRISI